MNTLQKQELNFYRQCQERWQAKQQEISESRKTLETGGLQAEILRQTELTERKNAHIHELVYLCAMEDEDAFRNLWMLCSPICLGVYSDMVTVIKEVSRSDWMKEGLLVLDHAIRRFRTNNGNSFQTFYRAMLRRKATDLFRVHCSQISRMQPELPLVSDQEAFALTNLADSRTDVHNQVLAGISLQELMERFEKAFSDQEMKVFVLLMQGSSKNEVIRQLGITRYRLNQILKQAREICQEADIKGPGGYEFSAGHVSSVLL